MTMRALIVEDEAVPARHLVDILMRVGYQVCGVAADYDAAVSLAHQENPDIALLDVRLRGKRTGLEVADYFRQHFRLPIVFLTSLSDRDTIARARALKANGFIVKPFTENIVYAATETAFGNYVEAAQSEICSIPNEKSSTCGLAPHVQRRVRDHIEANFHDDLRLDALAEIADMSRFHFAAMFRVSFGESPHRYVIQRRVAKASELLRDTHRPIIEVGQEVGYENQSYFTTLFKRETGHTPAAYRKRFGTGAQHESDGCEGVYEPR